VNNGDGGTNQDTWQAYMDISQCNPTVQPMYANKNVKYKRNVKVIPKTSGELFVQAFLIFVCLFV
jgi:hypothetical protein